MRLGQKSPATSNEKTPAPEPMAGRKEGRRTTRLGQRKNASCSAETRGRGSGRKTEKLLAEERKLRRWRKWRKGKGEGKSSKKKDEYEKYDKKRLQEPSFGAVKGMGKKK